MSLGKAAPSMPIELPIPWIVSLNALGWPSIQLALAWAFTRLPDSLFHPPSPAEFEADGDFYQSAFRIRAWKDRLPDAATWFSGGFAKARMRQAAPEYLRRFIRETWRGELCHWTALAFTPLFFAWNPWWGDMIVTAYALSANLPCILAQRYNRIRLQRLIRRAGPASRASG